MTAFTRRLGPCAVLFLGVVLVGCVRERPEEATATDSAVKPKQSARSSKAPQPSDALITTVEREEPERDLATETPRLETPRADPVELDWFVERVVPSIIPDSMKARKKPEDPPPVVVTPVLENPGFLGRSGATKERLLREGGGNAGSEVAVARGLSWLAKQQKADGSWRFDGSHKEDTIASTGLALLPFLAAGETHLKNGKYKQTVLKGLQYLVANLNTATGKFAARGVPTMYTHGIATIALCEAYGMTTDRAFLLRPATAAINLIQQIQGPNGGWRYPMQPVAGDTSVVGWQIQALQAAHLSKDIPVNVNVIRNAERFLDLVSGGGDRKSTYGYTAGPGAPGTSMTAVGLLSRYYISKWGPNHLGMAEGVQGLLKNGPQPGTKANPNPIGSRGGDLYYYYYATQVLHFYGGNEWMDWNEGPLGADGQRTIGMRDWLCTLQIKNGADAGSWDPDRGSIGGSCGRVGSTCLSLLMLEVYYRHLPLYTRSAEPAKDK